MIALDLRLMMWFQYASDWIQNLLGINNFKVAHVLNICILFSSLAGQGVFLIGGIKTGSALWGIWGATILFIVMFLVTIRLDVICKTMKIVFNPITFNMIIFRIPCIALMIYWVFTTLVAICVISITEMNSFEHMVQVKKLFNAPHGISLFMFVYFVSCTPKPKKPSRLRKFLKRILASPPPRAFLV